MNPRIGVLLPYFGNIPELWNIYLKGVKINPELDFIVLSDCIEPEPAIENLVCIPSSLTDIKQRAESALDMKISLLSHKKLCDLKPMYGEVFKDLIKGYDFWGFGDIDLIYGRLARFISAQIQRSDILSFRTRWLSGSLVLIRNTPVMNTLFKESHIWRDILTNPKHIGFGELCGIRYKQRLAGVEFSDLAGSEESFSAVVDRAHRSGQIRFWSADIAKESLPRKCVLMWKEDGLFELDSGREWAYYHLVFDKRRYFDITIPFDPEAKFYISSTGFYNERQFHSKKYPLIVFIRRFRSLLRLVKRKLKNYYH